MTASPRATPSLSGHCSPTCLGVVETELITGCAVQLATKHVTGELDMTASILRDQAGGWVDSEQNDILPSTGQTTWASHLPVSAAAVTLTGVAYWIYCGLVVNAKTAAFVRFTVGTGGTGAQTAEVALCSSPLPPNGAGQTLTKIAANATLTALTGTGAMANTVTFAQAIPARTHLWAGIRTALASSQPAFLGITGDAGTGQVLSTAAAGVLTAAGPFVGALIADTGVWMAPRLVVTTF